ncbi:multidrug efflux MFS transporter [Brucella tritici]|uniref:Multidrug efflux MFS transporter n=1 Tax=Brucella tritici TaxID=94626 RepID=A0A7X6FS06_9HYPH|nr:hypothetical protein [Brucella tritici]KAB2661638.1 multidrug efflux MFS transporter [Brucella tritici]NKW10688.1 multidrug efflux MFS transporter [Brucella tritici]
MTSAYLLPQYLIRIQGYRALESGTMFWVSALPQIVLTPFVAWLAYRMDPRSLAAFGLMLFGAGVLMLSDLTHLWTSDQILPSLFVQSIAAPFTAIPLMVLITEDISVREIPWIASLVHIVRTVGTAIGLAAVSTFTRMQEQLHSNLLGLHLERGAADVQGRIDRTAAMLEAHNSDPTTVTAQATAMLTRTVQREAFVLAYSDMFVMIGLAIALAALATLFMRRPKLPGKFL